MESSELAVLRERYTDKGTWIIGYYDDCKYEQSACKKLLPYLQGFEAPDMIAISDKELLILEHFSFDGSKETRKGMIGHRQEKNVEQELEQYFETVKESTIMMPVDYKQSTDCYIKNLTKHFYEHYSKIPQYIRNVETKKKSTFSDIHIGFFIENLYPPYFLSRFSSRGQLTHLCFTKQFLDIFETASQLEFVLFGYYNKGAKLHYIDKYSVHAHREIAVDLTQGSFLKLNEVKTSMVNYFDDGH